MAAIRTANPRACHCQMGEPRKLGMIFGSHPLVVAILCIKVEG